MNGFAANTIYSPFSTKSKHTSNMIIPFDSRQEIEKKKHTNLVVVSSWSVETPWFGT